MESSPTSSPTKATRFGWIANPDYREDAHHSRRRSFLLDAGQSLLLVDDPVRSAINYGLFKSQVGFTSGDDLVVSRMSPVPFPVRAGRPGDASGRRRVAGVRPEAMWLPTLWLPADVTGRHRFEIRDGEVVDFGVGAPRQGGPFPEGMYRESEELWVIRLCLELSESGVYDPYTGTWLDVLDLVGIDVDEPRSVQRVQAWLDGGADADLELLESGLELGAILSDASDPGWALSSALAMYDQLLYCSWALGADSLRDVANDILEDVSDGSGVDPDACRFMLEMVCTLGSTWFAGDRGSPGVTPGDEESDWWDGASLAISSSTDGIEACRSIAPRLVEHLTEMRDRFWPLMESAVEEWAGPVDRR